MEESSLPLSDREVGSSTVRRPRSSDNTHVIVVGHCVEHVPYYAVTSELEWLYREKLSDVLCEQHSSIRVVNDNAYFACSGPGGEVDMNAQRVPATNYVPSTAQMPRHLPLDEYVPMCKHVRPEQSEEHTASGTKENKIILVHDLEQDEEHPHHHVTEEEMKRVIHLMLNGMSMDHVLTTLDMSLPEVGTRGRRSNKRGYTSQMDMRAFSKEVDAGQRDAETANLVVSVVIQKLDMLPKEGMELSSGYMVTRRTSERIKDEEAKQAKMERDLRIVRERLHKDTGSKETKCPRYLCVFGSMSNAETRTRIEKTTNPQEKLNQLNKGCEKAPAWFSCLYVTVPLHVRNAVLNDVVEKWKLKKRRIACRTMFGIFLAEVLEGTWFISEQLNNEEFEQFVPFFPKQTYQYPLAEEVSVNAP